MHLYAIMYQDLCRKFVRPKLKINSIVSNSQKNHNPELKHLFLKYSKSVSTTNPSPNLFSKKISASIYMNMNVNDNIFSFENWGER